MTIDYLKEKKELVSVVLLGVSVVLAVSILVKVTGFFTASAKAENIVKIAIAQNAEDANDIDKYFAKYKKLADALKKNNLFAPPPEKQHPVSEITGIFGDEVIIRDKLYKVGEKVGDAKIVAIADGLISQKFGTINGPLPTMQDDPNMTKFYLWYYEALAFYQLGTETKYWAIFNPLMKKQMLTTQRMDGIVAQYKGSWNPPKLGDKFWHGCGNWGRVGQTAVGALMMEVYYRYEETK